MSDLTDFASRAVVPAIVAVCFGLARKYLKPSIRLPEHQLSILDERFQKTKWMVGISEIAVLVAFVWITHHILVWLNRHLAANDGLGTTLRLWPQDAIWWFFPGFGAVALCWEITLQLWSVVDRESARSYRLWSDGRAGIDGTRILRWMVLVIVAPIGFFTILALPMHTALGEQDIRVCGYAWAKCQRFDYSRAVRMTQIEGFRNRYGKLTHRAGIVLDFADGRRWSSADISDFQDAEDPVLRAFLVERTHLPVEQAETDLDIPKVERGAGQSTNHNVAATP